MGEAVSRVAYLERPEPSGACGLPHFAGETARVMARTKRQVKFEVRSHGRPDPGFVEFLIPLLFPNSPASPDGTPVPPAKPQKRKAEKRSVSAGKPAEVFLLKAGTALNE